VSTFDHRQSRVREAATATLLSIVFLIDRCPSAE